MVHTHPPKNKPTSNELNRRVYSLIFFFLFLLGLTFTGCEKGPDIRNCDEYDTINYEIKDSVLFDYENTDTLYYVRIKESAKDTLTFTIQERIKNVQLYINQEGSPGYCSSFDRRIDNEEFIYKELNEDIDFRVQIHGGGGTFFEDLYFCYTPQCVFDNWTGFLAGRSPETFQLETSTGVFYGLHSHGRNDPSFQINKYGQPNYIDDSLNCTSNYNKEFGMVRMTFDNDKEIWDLIPDK